MNSLCTMLVCAECYIVNLRPTLPLSQVKGSWDSSGPVGQGILLPYIPAYCRARGILQEGLLLEVMVSQKEGEESPCGRRESKKDCEEKEGTMGRGWFVGCSNGMDDY